MRRVSLFLIFAVIGWAEVPNHKSNMLSVIGFGDTNHEREIIFVYTAKNGLTLLQQNRLSPDNTVAAGSFAAGWKFNVKKGFSLTIIIGPAFSYRPEAGYDGRLILYSISNWYTKYFRLNNSVKLSLPTRETSTFGGRFMQTISGPLSLPPPLRGLALGLESLRINNRGWQELRVGPTINIGEFLGRKGFWSRVTILPYRDLHRPQPGKPQLWDLRIQYIQTFRFGK